MSINTLAMKSVQKIAHIIPVANILNDTDRRLQDVNINIHTTKPGIHAHQCMTDSDFINVANQGHNSTLGPRVNIQCNR